MESLIFEKGPFRLSFLFFLLLLPLLLFPLFFFLLLFFLVLLLLQSQYLTIDSQAG